MCSFSTLIRDAPIFGIGRLSASLPIIGIGRLLPRYRPIVIYLFSMYNFLLDCCIHVLISFDECLFMFSFPKLLISLHSRVKTEKRSNMMALDTEIMFLKICKQRHKFSFYS